MWTTEIYLLTVLEPGSLKSWLGFIHFSWKPTFSNMADEISCNNFSPQTSTFKIIDKLSRKQEKNPQKKKAKIEATLPYRVFYSRKLKTGFQKPWGGKWDTVFSLYKVREWDRPYSQKVVVWVKGWLKKQKPLPASHYLSWAFAQS